MTSCSQQEMEDLGQDVSKESSIETLIPLDEAISQAEWYVSQLSKEHGTRSEKLKLGKVEFYSHRSGTRSAELPSYYIINFENDGGFAVVPADTRLPQEAYAFSDEGRISLADTVYNKPLQLFFDALPIPETQSVTRAIGDEDAKPPTKMIQEIVPPLFTTSVQKWSQTSPFNKYCPVFDDENAPVGCPALAFGMLISHFESPSSYNGYSFPWKAMKNGSNNDAVARMLQQVGLEENLDITYFSSSAAGILDILFFDSMQRVCDNFGYDYSFSIIEENAMNVSLSSGSPIILFGSGKDPLSNQIVGHVWNIDGYGRLANTSNIGAGSSVYYYHCVWGWEGKSNGYFKCSNLGTSNAGIGGEPADGRVKPGDVPVPDFNTSLFGKGVAIFHSFTLK